MSPPVVIMERGNVYRISRFCGVYSIVWTPAGALYHSERVVHERRFPTVAAAMALVAENIMEGPVHGWVPLPVEDQWRD